MPLCCALDMLPSGISTRGAIIVDTVCAVSLPVADDVGLAKLKVLSVLRFRTLDWAQQGSAATNAPIAIEMPMQRTSNMEIPSVRLVELAGGLNGRWDGGKCFVEIITISAIIGGRRCARIQSD